MSYEETFDLAVTPPFRLDLTVWSLRRRPNNLVDAWNGKQYARVFATPSNVIRVSVEQRSEARLTVVVNGGTEGKPAPAAMTKQLERMLGLNTNLGAFYQLAEQDAQLESLVTAFKGVKPPRFPTMFESLINAIACQQVTLDVGILLLNRLSEAVGPRFEDKDIIQYSFPRPEDLADVSETQINKLGFSRQKARAIIDLSQAIVRKEISLTELEALPNEKVVGRLLAIRGIGRWSAEYVLLRGLGRIDIFPGDDVGAQKNLCRLFHLHNKPDYDQVRILTSRWRPFAGLVYFHLLLGKLHERNLV